LGLGDNTVERAVSVNAPGVCANVFTKPRPVVAPTRSQETYVCRRSATNGRGFVVKRNHIRILSCG